MTLKVWIHVNFFDYNRNKQWIYISVWKKTYRICSFIFLGTFFIAYFESNNSFFFFCRCYFASFISCLALPGEPSSKILSFVHGREERVEGVTRSERERERAIGLERVIIIIERWNFKGGACLSMRNRKNRTA